MQEMSVQSPVIVPHGWLQAVDLHMVCGLPEGDLKCLVAFTLANFFGWHAGSIFLVPLTLVKHGPDEEGYLALEFGTSVFKASHLYPVGCFELQELPGLLKLVFAFVVA